MDEAASRLRIEIDSIPTELDTIERRIRQLEIERTGLAREKDDPSAAARLAAIEKESSTLREEATHLRAHWQVEKTTIGQIRDLKRRIEELKEEEKQQERRGALDRVAAIRYGEVPKLAKDLENANKRLIEIQKTHRMLKEEVEPEDVAAVISKWTGIPVSKLIEGEKQKLIHMEERLAMRVVGQDEAIGAVSNAIRRARAGLQDPNRPIGSFLFLGPTGVGRDRADPRPRRVPLRRREGDGPPRHVRIPRKHTVSRLVGAPPDMWDTRKGVSSRRPCAGARTPSSSSTRSRRPTPTCSTRSSRSSTTAASPTARGARWTSATHCW